MTPTTPEYISQDIAALCVAVAGEGIAPVYLEVTPVDHAEIAECFTAVDEQVNLHGGEVSYGWRIWELPNIFIEAEFHAVWRNSDGDLKDITPLPGNEQRILFLPDPVKRYDGHQVNNIRQAIFDHPAVHGFIRACNDMYEFMNRGSKAEQHGRIVFSGAEKDEVMEIESRKAACLIEAQSSFRTPGRNDKCFCGSGKKFKKCHGAPRSV